MALQGYVDFFHIMKKFRNKEISFQEFSARVRSSGSLIGNQLDYPGDFENHLDAWMEYIEFCYLEEDWHSLGCSVCDFLEDAIMKEPKPLFLPKNDRVIKDQKLGVVEQNN